MGVDLYLKKRQYNQKELQEIGYWRNDLIVAQLFIDVVCAGNFGQAECQELEVDANDLMDIKKRSEYLTQTCNKALKAIENGDKIYFLMC